MQLHLARWRASRAKRSNGRHTPKLWPVWLTAFVAVAVAVTTAYLIYQRLAELTTPATSDDPLHALEVIKTTLAMAAFVGAVLAGVYAYRKQRIAEGDAHRADAEQFAQRYTTAAEQLGHEKPAVRLAGVYALARLADDWLEQRQVCIDVLCAYIRMPYEPRSDKEGYKEGERNVRHTILRIFRDHLLNPDSPTTWCGYTLDFPGAVFDGGNFEKARFTGGNVSFRDAQFIEGNVEFSRAKFTGGRIDFTGADFRGGKVSFFYSSFIGGSVAFNGATFNGGHVDFSVSIFDGAKVDFGNARFKASDVDFIFMKLNDGAISFNNLVGETEVSGGKLDFFSAELNGGSLDFRNIAIDGGEISFSSAEFSGSTVYWGDLESS